MKLIDCYIENFGKLSDFKLSFSPGLNTVKNDNGYGKTTLSVFIKAMFFGLDATKKTKLEANDRKRYLPWQSTKCGGSLTFEANGKTYLIERTFSDKASKDTFKLYDKRTGKESADFTENIGEELFGIDADGFERTVFLSEANLSGKNENKSVSAKLSDLVGCDGDLSVMDDAIELLEKQRKIYRKRGGTGEIDVLERKASEIEREINDLLRTKQEYEAEKRKLFSVNGELEQAYELKNSLIKEARARDEARLKRIYEKQYEDMRNSIKNDEETKIRLENFFKNGLPTAEEIENAKELATEAKRLAANTVSEESVELKYLAKFFSSGVSDEEFDKIKRESDEADKRRQSAEIIEKELLRGVGKETSPDIRLNDAEEHIDALSKEKAHKKQGVGRRFAIPLGISLIILGVTIGVLINPALLTVSVLGIALLLIGVRERYGSKKANENAVRSAREFVNRYGISDVSDERLLEVLYEIKAELAATERSLENQRQLRGRLSFIKDEISLFEREACEFIARFPATETRTVKEALDEIFKKRETYISLIKEQNASAKKAEQGLLLAKEYAEKSNAFISLFPTLTERPFDEISANLIEYTAICRSLDRMRESLEDFAKKHGIDEGSIPKTDEPSYEKNPNGAELDEKISELERSKAVLERQCRIMSEQIERIDELTSQKEILLERISVYEYKFDIIQKTKSFLANAKDSLTSKYLSKTKTAFDKYISLIGDEASSDFQMDTSFAVMKNEHGSLKPQEAYSKGTRDLYALVTRFALIESLYESEHPFIILDDPFAYFDDSKLRKALSAIKALAKEKQIIYLTCSNARII
jgi:uncharacterized protein YhaN